MSLHSFRRNTRSVHGRRNRRGGGRCCRTVSRRQRSQLIGSIHNEGQEAKHNLKGFANVTGNAFVASVKRRLGQEHNYSILGERKQAWEIAADIFRFLKRQASDDYKEDVDNVVVTVPVYYDSKARSDLRKAANAAGMQIKTFIHEPFAAVIGFCHSTGANIEALNGSNVMVFDWGGGTLDITIARIKDGRVFEVATAGLKDIAGDHCRRATGFCLGRNRFRKSYSTHRTAPYVRRSAPSRSA